MQHAPKALVITGFILFAAFNIATAQHSPMPWLDEVAYADPAGNYYFQGLFQSSLWAAAGRPFWVGNVPLHQFILIILCKVFGFSIYLVRGVSVIYYSAAVMLLLRTIKHTSLIQSARMRFFAVIMAFSATGCVAIYRNGRYDALGFLLASIAVATAFRSRQSRKSELLLFASCALIPWAGLQVIPFFGMCTLFYLGMLGKAGWRGFLLGNGGLLIGIILLLLFYASLGQLDNFIRALHSQGHVWQDMRLAVMMNPTYLALVGIGVSAGIFNWKYSFLESTNRIKVAHALVFIGLVTPWVMHFVSKYTIYYTWMATIPALIGVAIMYENCALTAVRRAALVLVILSAIPGYPRRLLSIASGNDMKRQLEIQEFINKNVSSDDKTMLDMECLYAYYSTRTRSRTLNFDLPENEELNRQSTCIVANVTNCESEYKARIGGDWKCTTTLPANITPRNKLWDLILGKPQAENNSLVIYHRL